MNARSLRLLVGTAAAALLAGGALAQAPTTDELVCARMSQGDALAACNRLVLANPQKPADIRARAHVNRGALAELERRDREALSDYDAAIGLAPSFAFAYVSRADVLARLGEPARARADLETAIRLAPTDPEARMRRAEFLAETDMVAAIADLDAALAAAPRNTRALVARAALREKRGELDLALADVEAALRIEPTMARAWMARGALATTRGDLATALGAFEAAIRHEPDQSQHYINRAAVFDKQSDWVRALADYESAVTLAPTLSAAHNGRSWALFKLGRLKEALASADRALELEPASPEALDTRAGIHEAMGALDKAFADISRAVALAAGHPEAMATYARIKAKLDAGAGVPAGPEVRVALVIGNGAYSGQPSLPNPPRDARAVAEALASAGFRVVALKSDVSRAAMIEALRAFEAEAEKADWAVVYYAGHGIEIGGVNYLIPVDASLKADRDIDDEAVTLERVQRSVERARRMRLVILDACRDNPFAPKMRRTIATRAVGQRGLAAVEPTGGVLVAFAAKQGEAALDGESGRNSPFVQALVRRIGEPGLEIGKLFRHVRDDVLVATGRKQEPFVYGSLPAEDLFFRAPPGGAARK